MKKYFPPKIPITPQEAAENRARLRARLRRSVFWIAVLLPLLLALMVYGYSDQAPASLRSIAIMLDGLFGYPLGTFLNVVPPR
ncbi:MAG: hypothetical protein M3R18_01485 [Pseudomonadota bacterium]|nr:hypothetical protein [Pseudomonadota bacterium]